MSMPLLNVYMKRWVDMILRSRFLLNLYQTGKYVFTDSLQQFKDKTVWYDFVS